jgi:hypothetical protein
MAVLRETVTNWLRRKQTPALALLLLGCSLTGCSRRAGVVLYQPFAPPSQQELRLRSRWAFGMPGPERYRCLLDFPRPWDADGPRDFHIYLTLPRPEGDLVITPDDPGGVRGFLIQEVGQLRGKTEFRAGTVGYRRVFLQPRFRRLNLNVQCADGTSISGKAYVAIDERELRKFEREFAADIRGLRPEESQPEQAGEPTATRNIPPP